MLLWTVHNRNASSIVALLGYLQPAAKLVTGHWWQGTWGQVALTHADTISTQYLHKSIAKFCRHIYQILSIIYYLHTYAAGARRDCVKWHGGVYRDSRQPRPATSPPPPPLCSIKHGGGPAWRRQLAAAAGRGSRRRSAACPSPSTGVSVVHSSQ